MDSRPAGSLAGVSAFQLSFSSHEIHTPGDRPGALVAMNYRNGDILAYVGSPDYYRKSKCYYPAQLIRDRP